MILHNHTDMVIKMSENLLKSKFISRLPVNENFKRKLAFTLAEVLITLLIIGVVASMVIPALINSSNEAEYNAGIKKIYAELSNTIKMIQANGDSVHAGDANVSGLRNSFCNIMTCIQNNNVHTITYKRYESGLGTSIYDTYYKSADTVATLNNGTFLTFASYSDCAHWDIYACGSIHADLNGDKGPNMWGKDFYRFYIIRQNGNGIYSVVPAGIQGDTHTPVSDCKVGDGWSCAALRLTNPDAMP